MLFYHFKLRRFVVVELKAVKFDPGMVGQLHMYRSAVDDMLKQAIGLLLCRGKNELVVEYALPIWNNRVPRIMLTFAEAFDFSGKTVYPFTIRDERTRACRQRVQGSVPRSDDRQGARRLKPGCAARSSWRERIARTAADALDTLHDRMYGNCTVANDPDDGLPVQCVGPWAKEKHHYLRNYIAATRHVRTQYVPPRGDGGTVFIDLFAGPGKARIRDTGEFIDGSPLIAVNEQSRTFTDIILCDLAPQNIAALKQRTAHTRRVRVLEGDCNELVREIMKMIPPRAYCVALIDPFGPGALDFNTIRRLAAFPRMDLIIHFPIGPMKRGFEHYRRFERFIGLPAEKWGVDIVHGEDIRHLIPVMRRQLMTVGYDEHEVAVRAPRVANTSNVALYHLVFASKHVRGDEIWNSVTKNAPNGQLSLL